MYNPQRFKCENLNEAIEFMDRNPFATAITFAGGEPFVSHIPFTPQMSNGQVELIGHMARANPHSKILGTAPMKVIFHGPHTYISPMWYEVNDVPTWNYCVAHVDGPVELYSEYDDSVDCLKKLSAHAEKHWPSGWEFFIPDDLAGDVLLKSILCFRVIAEKVNFKMKLGQNRSLADREGVMRGLEKRTDDNSRAIRDQMLKVR